MEQLLLIIHLIVALCLIGLVLIQQGKGAEAGAAFGSGASNTMFGSQGSGSFLLKFTTALAIIFFATSLALGYYASQKVKTQNKVILPVQSSKPAKVDKVKKKETTGNTKLN